MSSMRLHLWVADGEFTTSVAHHQNWQPSVEVSHASSKSNAVYVTSTSPGAAAYPTGTPTRPRWMQYLRLTVDDASIEAKNVRLTVSGTVPGHPNGKPVRQALCSAFISFDKLRRGAPIGFKKVAFQNHQGQMVGLVRLRAQLQYSQSVVVPPTQISKKQLRFFQHSSGCPEIILGLTGLAGFKDKDVLRFKVVCGSEVVKVEDSVLAGEVQVAVDDPDSFAAASAAGPQSYPPTPMPSPLLLVAKGRGGGSTPPPAPMHMHHLRKLDSASKRALMFHSTWQHHFWVAARDEMLQIAVKKRNIFGSFDRFGTIRVHLGKGGLDFAAETVAWREVLSASGKVVGRMRLSVQVQFPQSVIIPPGSSTKQLHKHHKKLMLSEQDIGAISPDHNSRAFSRQRVVSLRCALAKPPRARNGNKVRNRSLQAPSSGRNCKRVSSGSDVAQRRASDRDHSDATAATPVGPRTPSSSPHSSDVDGSCAAQTFEATASESKKKKSRHQRFQSSMGLSSAARDICMLSVGEAFADVQENQDSFEDWLRRQLQMEMQRSAAPRTPIQNRRASPPCGGRSKTPSPKTLRNNTNMAAGGGGGCSSSAHNGGYNSSSSSSSADSLQQGRLKHGRNHAWHRRQAPQTHEMMLSDSGSGQPEPGHSSTSDIGL